MINVDKDTETLIKKLVEGNEKAYLSIVDRYYNKLFIYAYSLTKNRTMADDIVQNVFMRIWEQKKKLKIRESLKSFLYKSIYNDFVNQYRKQQSSLVLDTIYIDTVNTLTDENNDDDIRLNIINNEIENLPNKCKQVFLLSKREGLTNKEISEYLNISVKAVENHITNAFSIIRNNIKLDKT